jgi:hypothetical protein
MVSGDLGIQNITGDTTMEMPASTELKSSRL